jgi:hypothetical protein
MKNTFAVTIAVVLLAVVFPLGVLISAQVKPGMQATDYRLSGPFTHKNLTIFLIHGKNMIEGSSFLTLQ